MAAGEECVLSASFSLPYLLSWYNSAAVRNDYLAVVLFVFISVVSYLYYLYLKIKPFDVKVPGPRRYPFIGIAKHLNDHWSEFPSEAQRLCEKHGGTWGGPVPNFGGLPGAYIFTSKEENVRHVLVDAFDNYVKGEVWQKILGDLLGEGIFNADGEQWRVQRKVMANMFSRNLMRHSLALSRKKFDALANIIEKEIGSKEAATVDMQDLFFRLTMDVTSMIAFGVELDSLEGGKQHPFAVSFDEMQAHIQKRFKDPLFHVKKKFSLTKSEREISRHKQVVDEFAFRIIESKRRKANEGHELGPDLLSRFLDRAKKFHGSESAINDVQLRDIVMNTLLAGRDTTACALSWMMFELTRHPDVAEKVVDEVSAVCGNGNKADYTYETIGNLKYCHAVVMETLRLHPSVPSDGKYAIQDDWLPDGTFVPAGAHVGYLPFAMGRSVTIWGHDALNFKPERFLASGEPSAFKFISFNAGPRLCLGKPLAIMKMKLALAVLLPKYHVSDRLGHSGQYKWTLVLQMKDGFTVDVRRRCAAQGKVNDGAGAM